ncbi:MAG: LytTR family transcriptional regulator [Clostridia bacterium]|nr:LytTR family transcriptional regulator [Clostridia bacterium]
MPYDVSVSFSEDESLDKIEIRIIAPERNEQVEQLLSRLSDAHRYLELPTYGGGQIRLRKDSIIRIFSENRNNYVCTAEETVRTTASVSELERQLGAGGFLRISRFEIINLDKAIHFDFSIVGELKIKMEADQTVFASRRYIPVIRDYLKGGDAK